MKMMRFLFRRWLTGGAGTVLATSMAALAANTAWPEIHPALGVIPSLDLIVSWNDANIRSRDAESQALRLLVEASLTEVLRSSHSGFRFPRPGESLENQARRTPTEVGLRTNLITELKSHVRGRWALWRHGFLVHVEGDFNQKSDVASLRKTWVNTEGDVYPGADKAWAWGAGAGGSRVMWNRNNGLVFAAFGADARPSTNGISHILERSIAGPNPLVQTDGAADVRRGTSIANCQSLLTLLRTPLPSARSPNGSASKSN